jgi:hypothetical protein
MVRPDRDRIGGAIGIKDHDRIRPRKPAIRRRQRKLDV